MDNFSEYLNSGHVWLYVPVAILLGALHGLEPGHSKTMMAAFIIAIRGTIAQAVLLGLSAAVSHSLIIWLLAALALHYGSQWNAETVEPYLQIGSAVIIFGLAVWMYFRTRREVREAAGSSHTHDHSHDHDAPLAGELIATDSSIRPSAKPGHGPNRGMMLDTGHGWLEIAIFEDGTPPRFRIYPCKANGDALPISKGMTLTIETARFDGRTQLFKFEPGDGFWESTAILPEPHEFMVTVTLSHDDHAHSYRLRFSEDHHHQTSIVEEMQAEGDVYQDAHERAHAEDIARRFSNRTVTTPQIVLFGITGGLMPCPAAFTILLVCLQLKKAVLGFSIVAAFSFGLALTMVTVGATAAWSVHHAQKRFNGFTEVMRKAPYVSCALLILLAAYMAWSGWQGLHQVHSH
ncbi:MAG: sulfite exporter TauE/SafE family protein [Verrucomicrobiae bacterium]|nr:sulfite exporter TauE/SafE family protein [Verrucomicrobiae bacterium]